MTSRILVLVLGLVISGVFLRFRGETADRVEPVVAAVEAPTGPSIIFLGDSLTHGINLGASQAFPALVTEKLRAAGFPHRVHAVGVSGMTTAGGLERIDWILEQRPDLLVLGLGGNDGLRAIPLESTRKNLETLITRAKSRGVKVVLAGMRVPPNYGEDYVKGFDSLFPTLAREHGLPLVPFLLEGVAGKPDLNQEDGIHPNAEGQKILAENVWKVLSQALRPDAVPPSAAPASPGPATTSASST